MSTDQRRTLVDHLLAVGVDPSRTPVTVEVIGERGHDGRHIAGDLAVRVAGLELDASALLLADGTPCVGRVDVRDLASAEQVQLDEGEHDDGAHVL